MVNKEIIKEELEQLGYYGIGRDIFIQTKEDAQNDQSWNSEDDQFKSFDFTGHPYWITTTHGMVPVGYDTIEDAIDASYKLVELDKVYMNSFSGYAPCMVLDKKSLTDFSSIVRRALGSDYPKSELRTIVKDATESKFCDLYDLVPRGAIIEFLIKSGDLKI